VTQRTTNESYEQEFKCTVLTQNIRNHPIEGHFGFFRPTALAARKSLFGGANRLRFERDERDARPRQELCSVKTTLKGPFTLRIASQEEALSI
jgi:hypothetical protein